MMRTTVRKRSSQPARKAFSRGISKKTLSLTKNQKTSRKAVLTKKSTASKNKAKTMGYGAGLNKLFLEELGDMHSAENQIVKSLPNLIKLASSVDLKEGLTKHLKETKQQVKRIEKIFSILGSKKKRNTCEAMQGLLKEAKEIVSDKKKSPLLDAAIICAAQKVEHYEIASYGTLKSFAKHLNFDKEIIELIQETLNEEGAANKHLTKIAVGSLIFGGVNEQAAKLTKIKG